jgi:outer membrane immunogenic protein
MKKCGVGISTIAALLGTPALAATALALWAGGAHAADLYTKAPAPPPAYSWTGFYAGLDVGYGWKDPTATFTPNDIGGAVGLGATSGVGLGPTAVSGVSFTNRGVFGGVEAGYNWQFNPNWVAGLEADFSWSDILGQATVGFPIGGGGTAIVPGTAAITASEQILWFGTVRPRLGWLATSNLLVYGTGGLAYGRVSQSVYHVLNSPGGGAGVGYPVDGSTIQCLNGSTCFQGTSTRTVAGWTAGAGAEARVPGTNASFKAEYIYVNLGGSNTFNVPNPPNFVAPPGFHHGSFNATFSGTDFHTVRIGLNWKLF